MDFQLIPMTVRSIFVAKQGTAVIFAVPLDVSGLPSGSIGGYDLDFRAKRTLSQSGYDIYFPVGSSGSVVALDYQTIGVSFQPIDTQTLLPGDYFWEIGLYGSADGVYTRTPYTAYGELFLLKSL
jgi:hypothetical protein